MSYKDPEQQKKWQREDRAKKRTQWLLENGPCKHCGSWENLNVDHIDPKLKISHSVWSWTKVRRDIELAKCQVLCFPCHTIKSTLERGQTIGGKHGASKYNKGCRCNICIEDNRKYKREWKRVNSISGAAG